VEWNTHPHSGILYEGGGVKRFCRFRHARKHKAKTPIPPIPPPFFLFIFLLVGGVEHIADSDTQGADAPISPVTIFKKHFFVLVFCPHRGVLFHRGCRRFRHAKKQRKADFFLLN
jgi:hypothetical protein